MLLEMMQATIESEDMIPQDGGVLVAVSGGLDSMVLLNALHRLREPLDLKLIVGHVDHGLRGTASEADAALVREVAGQLGIPHLSVVLQQEDYTPFLSLGREGSAREARRAALRQLAAESGASRIALAHTLEDRAETLLFNLVRGAGARGFSAMQAVTLPFIRPLIRVRRPDLLEYAREHGIRWREDASNADLSLSRNRIRHRVLPELDHINPRAAEALCRGAEHIGELAAGAETLAAAWIEGRMMPGDDGRFSLELERFEALPLPAQRLVLRAALFQARGSLVGITAAHIEAIRSLAASDKAHGECMLPAYLVRKARSELRLLPGAPETADVPAVTVDLGMTEIPALGIRLCVESLSWGGRMEEASSADPYEEHIDADCLSLPLLVRTRNPGDRFTPLRMSEDVKLKDFLINERVPMFDRDDIPILCDAERIVWVAGIRISDAVKITPKTKRVLRIRIEGTAC